jgi:acyl-CoA thioester hydrolase
VDRPETKFGPKLYSMQFPVRWGEMDALAHVNNAAYMRYFEDSRIRWSGSLGLRPDGKSEGFIVLKASVTYKKQLGYPADVEVTLFAGEIGRSSFHLNNTLTVVGDDSPTAIGEFVIVWFDFRAGKSAPIPAALRGVLEGKGAAI